MPKQIKVLFSVLFENIFILLWKIMWRQNWCEVWISWGKCQYNTFNFKSFQVATRQSKSLNIYRFVSYRFQDHIPRKPFWDFFHNLNLYVKGGKMDVQSQRRCVEVSGKSVPVQLNLWPSDWNVESLYQQKRARSTDTFSEPSNRKVSALNCLI